MASIISKTVKTIGTHNGVFHCDEVLGCSLLKLVYPNAEIIRTRDSNKLDTCDLVLDVGGVFDAEKLRFDHHQRSFNETYSSVLKKNKFDKVKLSSAGLIYCFYGIEILKILSPIKEEYFLEKLFEKVYENLIQEVDGVDNGVPMFEGEPMYHITTGLSNCIGRLNPDWNEPEDEIKITEQFNKAMNLTLEEFKYRVFYYSNVWWPARKLVLDAMNNRFNIHESGKIIYLDIACPWKSHFFELEEELKIVDEIKFAVFPGDCKKENYRVQSVPLTEKSFVLRTPLYTAWQGLRDEELSKLSGIPDCIFVHASGFIGGNKNKDGALQMAIKTLKLSEINNGKE